jgi:AraC-like DNA-binding protein
VVSLFNRGAPYGQRRVSPEGARCDWFVVHDDILRESLLRFDDEASPRSGSPFAVSHVPSGARLYLRQRTIVDAVRRRSPPSSDVEEAVLRIVEEVLDLIGQSRPGRRLPPRRGYTVVDLVAGAQAILAETYRERLHLGEVARELRTSATYLCRIFRRETGQTLSDYRRALRLRDALERLAEPGPDLASLSRWLGFSSQSHFTLAFRCAFGVTPSRYRNRGRRALLR